MLPKPTLHRYYHFNTASSKWNPDQGSDEWGLLINPYALLPHTESKIMNYRGTNDVKFHPFSLRFDIIQPGDQLVNYRFLLIKRLSEDVLYFANQWVVHTNGKPLMTEEGMIPSPEEVFQCGNQTDSNFSTRNALFGKYRIGNDTTDQDSALTTRAHPFLVIHDELVQMNSALSRTVKKVKFGFPTCHVGYDQNNTDGSYLSNDIILVCFTDALLNNAEYYITNVQCTVKWHEQDA